MVDIKDLDKKINFYLQAIDALIKGQKYCGIGAKVVSESLIQDKRQEIVDILKKFSAEDLQGKSFTMPTGGTIPYCELSDFFKRMQQLDNKSVQDQDLLAIRNIVETTHSEWMTWVTPNDEKILREKFNLALPPHLSVVEMQKGSEILQKQQDAVEIKLGFEATVTRLKALLKECEEANKGRTAEQNQCRRNLIAVFFLLSTQLKDQDVKALGVEFLKDLKIVVLKVKQEGQGQLIDIRRKKGAGKKGMDKRQAAAQLATLFQQTLKDVDKKLSSRGSSDYSTVAGS